MVARYEVIIKSIYALTGCIGLISFSMGVWTLGDPVMRLFYTELGLSNREREFDTNIFTISSGFAIGSGIFTIIIAIVGILSDLDSVIVRRTVCWGTVFTTAFSIAAIIILSFENDFVHRQKIHTILDDKLHKYYIIPEATEFFDVLHVKLKCCGVQGPDDFRNRDESHSIPKSCHFNFLRNNTSKMAFKARVTKQQKDTSNSRDVDPSQYKIDPRSVYRYQARSSTDSALGKYNYLGCLNKIVDLSFLHWSTLIAFLIILMLFQIGVIIATCMLRYKDFEVAPTCESDL